MTIRITHRRMSVEGSDHEHITHVHWVNADDSARNGTNTRRQIVDWINDGGVAYVGTGPTRARVHVVEPGGGRDAYLRTYADGRWTNNLLALPQF